MPDKLSNVLRVAAQASAGIGLFCVIYPIIYKILTPRHPLAGHHLIFLLVGFIFLADAWILLKIRQLRQRKK